MPAPPNRWGLPEALFGFAAGILVSAAATLVAEAGDTWRSGRLGPGIVAHATFNAAALAAYVRIH
ncbi:MAG: hypothetical protein M0Z42_07130 [Actinomycetota bacterium]|nr:hypothetical protein [Actinomycetota bacterium]